jgi:hypothetical protein
VFPRVVAIWGVSPTRLKRGKSRQASASYLHESTRSLPKEMERITHKGSK